MQSKTVKCTIQKSGDKYYLMNKQPQNGVPRILASNRTTRAIMEQHLPEYVIEAYELGIREFELAFYPIQRTVTFWEPEYSKQGLLEVKYNKPKKEMFTREEVAKMLEKYDSMSCTMINYDEVLDDLQAKI